MTSVEAFGGDRLSRAVFGVDYFDGCPDNPAQFSVTLAFPDPDGKSKRYMALQHCNIVLKQIKEQKILNVEFPSYAGIFDCATTNPHDHKWAVSLHLRGLSWIEPSTVSWMCFVDIKNRFRFNRQEPILQQLRRIPTAELHQAIHDFSGAWTAEDINIRMQGQWIYACIYHDDNDNYNAMIVDDAWLAVELTTRALADAFNVNVPDDEGYDGGGGGGRHGDDDMNGYPVDDGDDGDGGGGSSRTRGGRGGDSSDSGTRTGQYVVDGYLVNVPKISGGGGGGRSAFSARRQQHSQDHSAVYVHTGKIDCPTLRPRWINQEESDEISIYEWVDLWSGFLEIGRIVQQRIKRPLVSFFR